MPPLCSQAYPSRARERTRAFSTQLMQAEPRNRGWGTQPLVSAPEVPYLLQAASYLGAHKLCQPRGRAVRDGGLWDLRCALRVACLATRSSCCCQVTSKCPYPKAP